MTTAILIAVIVLLAIGDPLKGRVWAAAFVLGVVLLIGFGLWVAMGGGVVEV